MTGDLQLLQQNIVEEMMESQTTRTPGTAPHQEDTQRQMHWITLQKRPQEEVSIKWYAVNNRKNVMTTFEVYGNWSDAKEAYEGIEGTCKFYASWEEAADFIKNKHPAWQVPLQGQAPHPGFQVPLFGLTSTQSGSTTTVGLESAAKNLFSIPKPSTKLQTMPLTATSDMRDQDAWYGATSFSQMPGKSARKIPY